MNGREEGEEHGERERERKWGRGREEILREKGMEGEDGRKKKRRRCKKKTLAS